MYRDLRTASCLTEGHPNRLCDQICDAIVDDVLHMDPASGRVHCHAAMTDGSLIIAGEVISGGCHDLPWLARRVIRETGYDGTKFGFGPNGPIMVSVNSMMPDIIEDFPCVEGSNWQGQGFWDSFLETWGATDNATAVGFACDETVDLLPLPIVLARNFCTQLSSAVKSDLLFGVGLEGDAQVTVEYRENSPVRVDSVAISARCNHGLDYSQLNESVIAPVVARVVPPPMIDEKTIVGLSRIGYSRESGGVGWMGMSNQQQAINLYGPEARQNCGGLSGRDPRHIQRCGTYMVRYIAKNVVAAGLARRFEVLIAYVRGEVRPQSIRLDAFGTETIPLDEIRLLVQRHFDLRPAAIIRHLDLLRPIYRDASVQGPFGYEKTRFRWEETDKARILREEAGLVSPEPNRKGQRGDAKSDRRPRATNAVEESSGAMRAEKALSQDGSVLREQPGEAPNRSCDTSRSDSTSRPDSRRDYREADFCGADLSGADLSRKDLTRAKLRRANLKGANLSNSILQGADLTEADLSGSCLRGASVSGASLAGAILQGANLSEAHLSGADLQGADLTSAQLLGTNVTHARLSGSKLVSTRIRGADFTGANLSGALVSRIDSVGARITGIQLASTTSPAGVTRCPICERQGILSEASTKEVVDAHYQDRESLGETRDHWGCGHYSVVASRFFALLTEGDENLWLQSTGLDQISLLFRMGEIDSPDLIEPSSTSCGLPNPPAHEEISECFSQYFEMLPLPSGNEADASHVVTFSEGDAKDGLRKGWGRVVDVVKHRKNPFRLKTRGWGVFEEMRRSLLERCTEALGRLGVEAEDRPLQVAGFPCAGCGIWVGSEDEGACSECGSTHCPICGTAGHAWDDEGRATFWLDEGKECEHLLASENVDADDGWDINPFDGLELPFLAEEGAQVNLSDEVRKAAFGNLFPYLEAYEAASGWHYCGYGFRDRDHGLLIPPEEHKLFELWLEKSGLDIKKVEWNISLGGLGNFTAGSDFFAEDPESARREIAKLVTDLAGAFRRLRTLAGLGEPEDGE